MATSSDSTRNGPTHKPIRNHHNQRRNAGTNSEAEMFDEHSRLGNIIGMSTGEEEGYETVPGGWEGTDDATSTAPSDLMPQPDLDDLTSDPDASLGRGYGGGIGHADGAISDLKGTPVEDSRDWEDEPIVLEN